VTFGMKIVQARQDDLEHVFENVRRVPPARHPSLKKPERLAHGFVDEAYVRAEMPLDLKRVYHGPHKTPPWVRWVRSRDVPRDSQLMLG
jgi:hypothetical protein